MSLSLSDKSCAHFIFFLFPHRVWILWIFSSGCEKRPSWMVFSYLLPWFVAAFVCTGRVSIHIYIRSNLWDIATILKMETTKIQRNEKFSAKLSTMNETTLDSFMAPKSFRWCVLFLWMRINLTYLCISLRNKIEFRSLRSSGVQCSDQKSRCELNRMQVEDVYRKLGSNNRLIWSEHKLGKFS